MTWRSAADALADRVAVLLILTVCAGVSLDIIARWAGVPITGGSLFAGWALIWLAMVSAASAVPHGAGLRHHASLAIIGFALGTLGAGLASAAWQIGGVEPVLGLPVAWRFGGAAAALGLAVISTIMRTSTGAMALTLGAALSFAPPATSSWVAVAVFGVAMVLRVPVAFALVAAVAAAPGPLSDAAMAQTVLRGLGPAVLLAIPLFILAGALMVAGGIGEGLVSVAGWLSRRRATAAGEANVVTSLLFGGVSGSGIADAALGARLLVPPMVRAGYRPADAAALTATSAILPNLMPPSIALLLAAAATDQSVGRLWLAGIGAAAVTVAALWLVVRARAPATPRPPEAPERPDLSALLPPLVIAGCVVGGLRGGWVTATEAGLLAVLLAAGYAVHRRGLRPLWSFTRDAALQAGRVALLIGVAAPVSFLLATSGISWSALLPSGPTPLVMASAAALALLAGTVLDVGAAILLLLPILLPACTLAGADPVQATLVLVSALLIGGVTPPVGILVLTVKDITGITGVFRAAWPYILALVAALAALIAVPPFTTIPSRL